MEYRLLKEENIENIGTGYIYEHISTRAKIVYIKNNDKDKVFSITFRTLPKDNTGVFHILEHCVLCGSRKYPLKEPFNQLDKCTINTYLNAITFADKTLYPIASTNDKDYFKLMDVYLDAVFFPLIEEKKGIFLQEGWHLKNKNVNGIVYNEMKGVYSTPDTLIDFKTKEKLFSGEGYSYDSGGHPDYITDLTYDQFIKTYKEYYNPTNAIIYFYGDLDIYYYLDYLHNEYLSKFEIGQVKNIEKCKNLNEKITLQGTYPLDEEDNDVDEKNYIQATFKLKFSMEQEKSIAFDIISDILTENQEGILKKSFVENGICTDVTSYIDDDMIEPIFTILIEGTSEEDIEKFKMVLNETIQNIDIDEQMLLSGIATTNFYYKEKDFGYKPKGLYYNIELLKHMLYEKYDFDVLNFNNIIERVKNLNFKKLLVENLLENENVVYTILKPTTKKDKEKQIIFREDIKELEKYQQDKDTPEAISKISPLAKEDISKEILKINTEIRDFKKRPVIYNNINSEILYFNMLFDISNFSSYYRRYISLYVYLLGKLDTKNYTGVDLEQNINLLIGGGSTSNATITLENGKFLPMFSFSVRVLNENVEKAFNLINEMFENTLLSNTDKIKGLILEFLYKCEIDILKDPKQYSVKRAKSYLSEQGVYIEDTEGIEFYLWLKDLCKNIDKCIDDLIEKFEYLKQNIFNIESVYFGIACNDEIYNICVECLERFQFFNNNRILMKNMGLGITSNKNEAFYIPCDVNYNTKVCLIGGGSFVYTGYIDIIKRILQSDYIWEKVRTQGGAYGGEILISQYGGMTINSYSDPNVQRTYDVFDNIATYIYNLKIDEKELHNYKIGTINILDKPIKDSEINHIGMNRYFKKLTDETLYNERQQILDANLNDIKSYYEVFEKALKNSYICTVGTRQGIYDNRNIFDSISRLK